MYYAFIQRQDLPGSFGGVNSGTEVINSVPSDNKY